MLTFVNDACFDMRKINYLYAYTRTEVKDTHRQKGTLKLNSSAYEKYEYGHLGRWYIK